MQTTAEIEPADMVNPIIAPRVSLFRRAFRSNAVWLLLMFVSGLGVGSAGTMIQFDRMRRELITRPEIVIDKVTMGIAGDARLNREETEVIRGIVKKHHERMMAIFPQFTAELDVLEREIAEVLTPEQRARWEPRFKQFRQHLLL